MTKGELDYWLGEITGSIIHCYEELYSDDLDYEFIEDENCVDEIESFKEIIRLAKIGLQIENIVQEGK
jgi:hypothetical protein